METIITSNLLFITTFELTFHNKFHNMYPRKNPKKNSKNQNKKATFQSPYAEVCVINYHINMDHMIWYIIRLFYRSNWNHFESSNIIAESLNASFYYL